MKQMAAHDSNAMMQHATHAAALVAAANIYHFATGNVQ
jgi:hypothetical protein